MLEQIFFQSSLFSIYRTFDQLKILNAFDYHTVLLRVFFESFRGVLPTEHLNSLYEHKVFHLPTRKAQLNLFPLANVSCCVSHDCLQYKSAKLINCF